RLERTLKALEQEINTAIPGSRIQLKLAGDAILVSGATQDVRDTDQVLKIVVANAPGNGEAKVVDLIRSDGEQLHAAEPRQRQQHQREQTCRALERELAAAFPDSRVKLRAVGDTILVTGHVLHRREAAQILQIAGAGKDAKVIDRLTVVGAEQIMLKVVVAEVN